MFNLEVVAQRVDDEILLDQAAYEWCATVRLPKIESGACTHNNVPANYPVPRRAHR